MLLAKVVHIIYSAKRVKLQLSRIIRWQLSSRMWANLVPMWSFYWLQIYNLSQKNIHHKTHIKMTRSHMHQLCMQWEWGSSRGKHGGLAPQKGSQLNSFYFSQV